MKLDLSCNSSCLRIGWHWSCLWGTDRALEIFSNYITLCGWLHCYQGDHADPLPILTGWLTRLLLFCDRFRGWFYSRWPPHILLFSWRGICCEYLQVWKSFLDFFSAEFGVLELSLLFFFTDFVVLELSRDDFTKFGVLELFWNRHNPLFLWIGLARIFRACYFCF